MKSIKDIDKNFEIKTSIDIKGIRFFDPKEAPFKIHGVSYVDGAYRRLPEEIAAATSDSVKWLSVNTAGGRVRFMTDSPYVAVQTKMASVAKMAGFAMTGSSAFDIYAENADGYVYANSLMPYFDFSDGYESVIFLPGNTAENKMREITLNFPLYSSVEELYVGIDGDSRLEAAPDYKISCPVVFYGSSITQGGCASRPGNAYQCLLSRKFGFDFVNLGFAGSALAEDAIADYISTLETPLFVYDYDYNAPNVAHLEATHEKMFLKFRETHPETPVIFMSKPVHYLNADDAARLEVIRKTYNNALARGDRNVYLVSGPELMELAGCEGLVDACHPNDLGFGSMARALTPIFEKIFG